MHASIAIEEKELFRGDPRMPVKKGLTSDVGHRQWGRGCFISAETRSPSPSVFSFLPCRHSGTATRTPIWIFLLLHYKFLSPSFSAVEQTSRSSPIGGSSRMAMQGGRCSVVCPCLRLFIRSNDQISFLLEAFSDIPFKAIPYHS